MYNGKASNTIIKYKLKVNHEGNDDGKDFRDDIDGDENNFDHDDTCGAKNTLYGLKTSFSDQEHLYFWSKKLDGRRDPPQ